MPAYHCHYNTDNTRDDKINGDQYSIETVLSVSTTMPHYVRHAYVLYEIAVGVYVSNVLSQNTG